MRVISTILFTLTFNSLFAQISNQDSIKKAEKEKLLREIEESKKEHLKELSPALVDSFHIKAKLKDFNLGGTCGERPSAGSFIFKVKDSDKKEFIGKTVIVIIQCASNFEVKKKRIYNLTVTPTRGKGWVLIIWENYEKYNYPKLYEIHSDITIRKQKS